MKRFLFFTSLLLILGCSNNNSTKKSEDIINQQEIQDDVGDSTQHTDTQNIDTANDQTQKQDTITDTKTDEASEQPQTPFWKKEFPDVQLDDLSQPVSFKAGAAIIRIPAPLGINTAGFGPAPGYSTPYTGGSPGSWTLYMHPQFRAVALEGGKGRLIIVRADTVGILSGVRSTVIKKLKDITGHDFSDELILAGTHTHSGPGRLAKGAFQILLDKFWPEFFDRFTDAIVYVVLEAINNMKPAKFGWVMASNSDLHKDRRCENPPLEDPQMPLLRFDDLNGNTIALIMVYAIHGTVLGNKLHHFSRDVSGALELKTQELLGGHFPVLFINSWAADMSPGDEPKDTIVDNPSNSKDLLPEYERIEGLGNIAASTVKSVWNTFKFTRNVDIASKTFWIPLNREAMGYKDDEFPYEYGAVYCGGSNEGHCWKEGQSPDPVKNLDHLCIPFKKNMPAPDRTVFTVGHIGNLYFVTWPGEAVTSIGQDLRKYTLDKLQDKNAGFAFFGYAQDYTGYSTPEWDWWQGGYEASGAIWGPKQGDYITKKIEEGMEGFIKNNIPQDLTATSAAPPIEANYEKLFKLTPSIDPGIITQDVESTYPENGTVEFVVSAGDPWLLAPVAVLQEKTGDKFVDVKDTDGYLVTSDRYQFSVKLDVQPMYNKKADARKYLWKFIFALKRPQKQALQLSKNIEYRFKITGSYYNGTDQEIHEFSVTTSSFTIQ